MTVVLLALAFGALDFVLCDAPLPASAFVLCDAPAPKPTLKRVRLSGSELIALHNRLHGGGSWTWPGMPSTEALYRHLQQPPHSLGMERLTKVIEVMEDGGADASEGEVKAAPPVKLPAIRVDDDCPD